MLCHMKVNILGKCFVGNSSFIGPTYDPILNFNMTSDQRFKTPDTMLVNFFHHMLTQL